MTIRTLLLLSLFALLAEEQKTARFAEREPRYRLQPSDVLEISYRYTPEFNQSVSVQPDGFVSLHLIGDVKVSDLTLDETRQLIVRRSSERLRDPEIAILLKEYEKPHFVVAGEVANPGKFEFRGRVSALEAVAVAGGLKASAKHSQAILYRRVSAELAESSLVNLKRIASMQGIHEDPDLRPGDVLFIPQNRISKVERFVKWGNWGIFVNPAVR
jgi:polysaccharide biosynthesis/export protein